MKSLAVRRPIAALVVLSLSLVAMPRNAGAGVTPMVGSTITGRVFEDANVNGVNDTEDGVGGVTVKAYDSTGAEVGTATSAADGTYTLSVTSAAGTALRVEFTAAAVRLVPSVMGTDNGGDVQFVNAGATAVNFAMQAPGKFCDTAGVEPSLAVVRGTPNGHQQGVSLPSKGNCYLTSVFLASWSGHAPGTTGTQSSLLRHLDTGTTFGLAFDKGWGHVWTSAFIRRHSGLGPNGVGGVYVTTPGGGLLTSFDLQGAPWNLQLQDPSVDFSDAARGIDNSASPTYKPDGVTLDDNFARSLDLQAFDAVGKQGIGEIAIDTDNSYLYLTNLYQRSVQRLPITGTSTAPSLGSSVTSWTVPSSACPSDVARPFGLYLNPANGRPWVGIICTGEGTAVNTDRTLPQSPQNGAYIYELDTGTGAWTQITQVNLAYPHQSDDCYGPYPYTPRTGDDLDWGCQMASWNDWTQDWTTLHFNLSQVGMGYTPTRSFWYAQPIIAGIEQLADGSLVVGLMDRWNYMIGWQNLQPRADAGITDITGTLVSGDLLLLCKTASGYQQESDGGCTSTTRSYQAATRDSQVNSGSLYLLPPGSPIPPLPSGIREYFADNVGDPENLPSAHTEMSMGSIAVWPKTGSVADQKIAMASMDPWIKVNTNGVRWLSADTGNATSGLDLTFKGATTGFDKNANLGAVEIVCDRAPFEIGNRAWRDDNSNGIQDPGEPPIVGATVRLYRSEYVEDENGDPVEIAGELVGTAITDAKGQYRFSSAVTEPAAGTGDTLGGGLESNEPFMIKFDNPADFASAGPLYQLGGTVRGATAANGANSAAVDSDLYSNDYPTIFVPAGPGGVSNHDYDAGFVPARSIGSRVWIDGNADGVQDAGEPGFGGVLVKLLNPDETPALGMSGDPVYAITDAQGNYVFGNVPPGNYKIRFVLPSGATFTTANSGSDDKADSDADASTGITGEFTLAATATGNTVAAGDASHLLGTHSNPTIDAGVLVDPASISDLATFEGALTTGLTGDYNLIGIRVELTDPDGNPVTDISGEEVKPTYTDLYGFYLFENLYPGRYRLKFTLPNGLEFSPRLQGTNAGYDSDAYPDGTTDPFTLDPGAYLEGIGVVAHIASLVPDSWFVRIGNYVWFDSDRDGIQDADEAPIEGVNVYLQDPLGYEITSTTTDANGEYLFENLLPGGYTVRFEAPDGYAPTSKTQGSDDTKDSDANIADGTSDPFTVHAAVADNTLKGGPERNGQWYDETIDAGFAPLVVAVGNYTWVDIDEDGLQDENEPPLAQVLVELYDANGDPALDADGDPVDSVYTDADGFYLFDNLLPGEYLIRFTPPDGYLFTSEFQGDSSADDSNAFSDGWTDYFFIDPEDADTVVDEDPATKASYVNPTIDAGFIAPRVAVGDYTWFDSDADGAQDANEPPVPGVMVELLNPDLTPATDFDGNPVAAVYTSAEGLYLFDNLLPGDYRVRFTPPLGYGFTVQTTGASNEDSNPDIGTGVTPVFTLLAIVDGNMEEDVDSDTVAVLVDPTIDAGFVVLALPPTGGSANLLFALVVLLAGCGALLVTSRRRERRAVG